MEWTEASIYTSTEGVELLCGKLLELGINGFAVEDAQDFEAFLEETTPHWDYVDDSLMALKDAETRVIVYLPKNVQGAQTLAAVSSVVRALKADDAEGRMGRLEISCGSLLEEDWENNWKQYYKPLAIGEKLLVVPEWLNPENPENRVVVLLDPGMIFGTGAHASTQMCMRELERAIQGGEQVLDLGSGSGILSITALLLGASHATGVDIDPKAEDIARQNAAINQIFADRFTALTGDVIGDTAMMEKLEAHYDVVLANIVADVIIPLAPVVPHFLGEDSVFICSGILNTRLSEVISALEAAGLQVLSTEQQEDWCRVTAVLAG